MRFLKSQFWFNLAKTDTAKDSFISLFGNSISGFLGLIFTIIIARFLSPANFGKFSTITAYIIFISAIADLGANQALIHFVGRSKGAKQKFWVKAIFKLICWLSLIFAVASSLIFYFLLSRIWKISKEYAFLIFVGIIISVIFLFFIYLLQSFKKFFKKVLFENIFALSRMLILLAVLLFFKLDVFISVFVVIAGEFISLFFGWEFSPVDLKKARLVEIKPNKLKELMEFSKWLSLNNLFAQLFGRIDILMLAWLTTSFTTGIYSSAARFMLAFPVIVSSFSSVVAPRFAHFREIKSATSYFKKSLLVSLGLSIVMGGSIFILARPIIILSYGRQYIAAVPVLRILSLAFLSSLLSIPPVNSLVYFFKNSALLSLISGSQLILVLILNFIFIPKFSELGPALSLLAANYFGLLLAFLFFSREVRNYKNP